MVSTSETSENTLNVRSWTPGVVYCHCKKHVAAESHGFPNDFYNSLSCSKAMFFVFLSFKTLSGNTVPASAGGARTLGLHLFKEIC